MSRTIRRKNCYKSRWYVLKKEDIGPWEERKYGTTDHDFIIAKSKAQFQNDCLYGNYEYGFPMLTGADVRTCNRMEIIRCLKMDCWDDHKPLASKNNWVYW